MPSSAHGANNAMHMRASLYAAHFCLARNYSANTTLTWSSVPPHRFPSHPALLHCPALSCAFRKALPAAALLRHEPRPPRSTDRFWCITALIPAGLRQSQNILHRATLLGGQEIQRRRTHSKRPGGLGCSYSRHLVHLTHTLGARTTEPHAAH